MRKIFVFILSTVLIIGLIGCGNQKPVESTKPIDVPVEVPVLADIVDLADERLNEALVGLTDADLVAKWNQPVGSLGESKGDIWRINEDSVLAVYYNDEYVVESAEILSGHDETATSVKTTVYVYEKEGFGGEFFIEVDDSGSFKYYEGALSSYLGIGNWTVKDSVLCLKDDLADVVNYFKVEEGRLLWIADGSDGFMYVEAEDGDVFIQEDF